MPRQHDWRQWERIRASIFERAYVLYVQRKADLLGEFEDTFIPEMPEEYVEQGKRHLAEWLNTWNAPKAVKRQRLAEQLDPRQQLHELTSLAADNRDRLNKLLEDVQDKVPTFAEAQTIRTYTATSETLQRQMDVLATALDVEAQWADDREAFFDRKKAVKRRVLKDYRGKGQIYDMLCDRLASLQVGLERLESMGRLGTDQYQQLNEQWVSCVTQIQRHTESLKVEDVSPYVQQVGEKFMRILEGELALTQPALLVHLQRAIYNNVVEGSFEPGRKLITMDVAQNVA